MIKASSNEREVQTDWSKRKAVVLHERFLKGPIPFRHIGTAAKLPGQALSIFLAVQHQTALTRRDWVSLPKGLLEQLGVGRDAKARALQQLEGAGLVRVARARGRSARVSLVTDTQIASKAAAPSLGGEYIWQNRDWTITSAGLASRHQHYQIPVSQLTEVRLSDGNSAVAMWPLQMAEKSWVDIEMFIEAFKQALAAHQPVGWEQLDLQASFRRARTTAGHKTVIDQTVETSR